MTVVKWQGTDERGPFHVCGFCARRVYDADGAVDMACGYCDAPTIEQADERAVRAALWAQVADADPLEFWSGGRK